MSGELKHGPLALVDDKMPILFIGTKDSSFDKVKNAFSQIISRKGNPIVICNEGDEKSVEFGAFTTLALPSTEDCLQGILNVIPLQLLCYHVAILRGSNVDQPRNLAKSVTVE